MVEPSRVQRWLILDRYGEERGRTRYRLVRLCPGEGWGQPSGRDRGTQMVVVSRRIQQVVVGVPCDGAGAQRCRLGRGRWGVLGGSAVGRAGDNPGEGSSYVVPWHLSHL